MEWVEKPKTNLIIQLNTSCILAIRIERDFLLTRKKAKAHPIESK